MALRPLTERDRAIAAALVDAIGDDGYLHEDTPASCWRCRTTGR
jgi:DNA-directed RNA polymerase specialized sigma54-like protein